MRIIKIGKSPSNDIYREFQRDPTVSREHCEIFIDDDNNIFLTDLNSTNGTFVNGTKINTPVILKKLDIVRAGNSLVKWKEYVYGAEKEFAETVENNKNTPSDNIKRRLRDNPPKINKSYNPVIIIFSIVGILMLITYCTASYENELSDNKASDLNPTIRTSDLDNNKGSYNYEPEEEKIRYCPTPKNGESPYNAIFGRGIYSDYAENSFLIKNTQSSHAVVLLVNSYSGKKIRNEFIRKGSQFEMTKVPNGTYHLRWVSGNDWCPDIQFGSLKGGFQTDMSFSETSDPKDRMTVTGYDGWEVTLYAVVGGDVDVEGINQNDFIN